MGLVGEEFDGAGAAAVLTAEQTHLLRPCGGRHEGEGNVERGQDALDDACGSPKAEGRGHALAGHGVDFLDDGVGVLGVRPEESGEANGVHLVHRSRPAFDLSRGHVDNDEVAAIQIKDGERASSARVHANNFHGVSIHSPLNFVSPPCCGHFALGDIACVARFKRLVPRRTFGRSFDALLAEADRLYLVAFLGHNDVRLRRMRGGALGFVIPSHTRTRETTVFLHFFLAFFFAIFIGLPILAAAFLAAAIPLGP